MIVEHGYQVNSGDKLGEILGFEERLFGGWFEVYPDGRLYLHYLNSKFENKGHTQRLLYTWQSMGFNIYVVRPNDIMKHILSKMGYEICYQMVSGYQDESEVMYKPKDYVCGG